MFPFIFHKVTAVPQSRKTVITQPEVAISPKENHSKGEFPINVEVFDHPIFEDDDLCMIECDGISDDEAGEEMVRLYEKEEKTWLMEEAKRATRGTEQTQAATRERAEWVVVAIREGSEPKRLMGWKGTGRAGAGAHAQGTGYVRISSSRIGH